jgi:hypothetical protein
MFTTWWRFCWWRRVRGGVEVDGLMMSERAVVSTFAGSVFGTGNADGAAGNANFKFPRDVTVDASGNLFVADTGNQRIRKVTAGGGTRVGPVTLRACCVDIVIAAPA